MNRFSNILISLGVLLLVGAMGVALYNFRDETRAENASQELVLQLTESIDYKEQASTLSYDMGGVPAPLLRERELPDYKLNPDMDMPERTIDGYTYIGTLELVRQEVVMPIQTQWVYEKSKKSPCRYLGSVYSKDLILAAHNFQSHFGKIKDLASGDKVVFTDLDGNRFEYQVLYSEQLKPSDVELMVSGDWDMTLFTCTVTGGKRLTVRCRLMKDIPAENKRINETGY